MIGVTIGVAALIATLGIMTGFKEDLQAKILGTNSHIIVTTKTSENIDNYDALTDKVAAVPDVVAATPFIFKQVLLTSDSGSAGVVLRGIDIRREAGVTEIARNLKVGKLEELERLGPPRPDLHVSPPAGPPPRTLTPEPSPSVDAPALPGIIVGKELSLRLGVFLGD